MSFNGHQYRAVLSGSCEPDATSTAATLEVNKAPVTAGDYSGTYNGAAHTPTASAVTDDYTGDLTCTNDPASVGPDVGAGNVVPVLVLNGETEANFTDTSQNGSWEITQATLTVTADDQTAQYSDATPPLTCQYTGFVGSDGPDYLTTEPICSTERKSSDPASSFSITGFGGDDGSYVFHYNAGTLTRWSMRTPTSFWTMRTGSWWTNPAATAAHSPSMPACRKPLQMRATGPPQGTSALPGSR